MDHPESGCGSDKPETEGLWETTQLQLDSAIGDLQRGGGGKSRPDGVGGDEGAVAPEPVQRRSGRKKRRPKPPRVVPAVRLYVGTFAHSTDECPLVVLDRWMIGVDAGKVSEPVRPC